MPAVIAWRGPPATRHAHGRDDALAQPQKRQDSNDDDDCADDVDDIVHEMTLRVGKRFELRDCRAPLHTNFYCTPLGWDIPCVSAHKVLLDARFASFR